MQVFSFRAEVKHDVDMFVKLCKVKKVTIKITKCLCTSAHPDLPDREVELESENTIDELMEVLRGVDDSHVMMQTIRPVTLEENSLKRDFNIE
jgi:hypothetical protein